MALYFGFFLPVATTFFCDERFESGKALAGLDYVVGVSQINLVFLVLGQEVKRLLFGSFLGLLLSL